MKRKYLIIVGTLSFLILLLLYNFREEINKEKPTQPLAHAKEIKQEETKPKVVNTLKPKKELSFEEIEKRRRSVKINLSMIYTAEASFKADMNRYSTDLPFMGFSPQEREINFKAGFLRPFQPNSLMDHDGRAEDPLNYDTDAFIGEEFEQSGEDYYYSEEAASIKLSDYVDYCQQKCEASKDGFEYMVVIPVGLKGEVDVWVINEKKEIKQVKNGLQINL